jgi:hypothetical protein
MKKATFIMLLIPMLILAGGWSAGFEPSAYAAGGRGGGGHISAGGRGAVSGRGAGGGFRERGDFGGRGHFGHGGGHFSGGIWIDPWWWDPFFPFYPYPYSYYAPPTVVVPSEPQEYIQQPAPQEQTDYWYYCKDSHGYYPYVKSCPSGWMRVLPSSTPPDTDEEE